MLHLVAKKKFVQMVWACVSKADGACMERTKNYNLYTSLWG